MFCFLSFIYFNLSSNICFHNLVFLFWCVMTIILCESYWYVSKLFLNLCVKYAWIYIIHIYILVLYYFMLFCIQLVLVINKLKDKISLTDYKKWLKHFTFNCYLASFTIILSSTSFTIILSSTTCFHNFVSLFLSFHSLLVFHWQLVYIIWFSCFDVFLNYFWVYMLNMTEFTLYLFTF